MSQPPYGVPPQQGGPQGHPGQPAPPPAYLGGGAPPPQFQGGPPAYGAPARGPGLGGLAPASKPRSIGLVMGLLTTLGLIAIVVVVALITLNN